MERLQFQTTLKQYLSTKPNKLIVFHFLLFNIIKFSLKCEDEARLIFKQLLLAIECLHLNG